MEIAVCMKYVPADLTGGVDEKSGGIRRTEENSAINQADVFALEAALWLAKRTEGRVSVYTMGPAFARRLLLEACALGAERMYLLSDDIFAGSDTQATAHILSQALLKEKYDLILCGERTVDGETGQVPGELSAMLDLPFATGIIGVSEPQQGRLGCRRITSEGYDELETPLPALLGISCGMQGVNHPLLPTLAGLRRANEGAVTLLDAAALGLETAPVSPTSVEKVTAPDWNRVCLMADNTAQAAELTLERIYG